VVNFTSQHSTEITWIFAVWESRVGLERRTTSITLASPLSGRLRTQQTTRNTSKYLFPINTHSTSFIFN